MKKSGAVVRRVCSFLAALTFLLASPIALSAYTVDTEASPSPITGLWWNASESGWGATLTQQYDVIFVTMFTYDGAGNPTWYVVSDCAVSGGGCQGDLLRVTGGSMPNVTWNGNNIAAATVGTLSLAFTDDNTGTMNYTINGVPGSKAITRQIWRTVPSFPLQSAYKAILANGIARSFTISGTCSGTGSKTSAPATTAATFEGVAGFSAVGTLTMSLSAPCTPSSIAQTFTGYFDNNYVPLGMNSVGVNYGVYLTPPTIPTSVTVGGTGIVGTETLYTDSTKATGNGRIDQSYVIEADTSTTAIVNMIGKIYNAAGTLTATEQDRFRIAATGALTPVSVDIQYANGSTVHLLLTYH